MIGNYAYLAQANGEVSALDQLVDSWLSTYKRIVLVSLLDELSAEGMCAAEPLLQHAIDVRVRGELERCGVTFVELTEVAHERWLDLVEALRSMTSSPTVGLALTRRF